MTGLLFETREVGLADLRQFVFDAVAYLIRKVRINDRLSCLVDMLHEVAQAQPAETPLTRNSRFVISGKTWMPGSPSAKTRFALLPGHDG